jgi:(2Fe-2S) ferredoxin
MLPPTLLICQNTACRRSGSAEVLAAFEADLALARTAQAQIVQTATLTITGCRCLGQCGNGPVVLAMPEQTWYYQVHSDEVPVILQRHLRRPAGSASREPE